MNDLTGDKVQGAGQAANVPFPFPPSQRQLEEKTHKGTTSPEINSLQEDRCCYHWRSIVSSMFMFGGLATGILLILAGNIAWGAVVMVVGYLMYLIINCWRNSTIDYVDLKNKGEDLSAQFQIFKQSQAAFQFKAQCYHYERSGDNQTRVTTHRSSKFLIPEDIQDISESVNLHGVEAEIVFVEFAAKHHFKDELSQLNLKRYYQEFRVLNRHDVYQQYEMNFIIKDMPARRTYYQKDPHPNYQMYYKLFNCFGCSLPFSCWLQSKTKRYIANIVKVVKI